MNIDYRELEKRLREIPTDINIGWPSDPINFHAPHVHVDLGALCSASADAINALKAENERLRKALRTISERAQRYLYEGKYAYQFALFAEAAVSAVLSDSPADVKSKDKEQ